MCLFTIFRSLFKKNKKGKLDDSVLDYVIECRSDTYETPDKIHLIQDDNYDNDVVL